MEYKDLTPEQQEKLKACESPQDILALAAEEGCELSDEQIESISGGLSWDDVGDTLGGVAHVGAHKGTRGAG